MSDALPPLTALRAFEAAARHLSFAKAAEELHVTPAALSFQIKSLEDRLGQPLFVRLNRAVQLTEAGRTLSPGMTEGFQTLTHAWRATRRLQDEATLNVTAGPAFTSKWLAPRIFEFARQHPEIDLRFSATLRLLDLERDEIDVAIRFGIGPDEGLWSMPMEKDWVMPVMTPMLAENFTDIEQLKTAPLLVDHSIDFLSPRAGWKEWFKAVGIDHNPSHATHFSQADHIVDAALANGGVALARRSVVLKELQDGALVAPFKTAIQTAGLYRFVCRKGTEDRPQIAAFREWVLAEIEKRASVDATLNIIPIEDLV